MRHTYLLAALLALPLAVAARADLDAVKKAEARRFTRVRRLRYYPVRIVGGRIELAWPAD